MTVNELCAALPLEVFALGDGERELTGGYAGDLLSWVMSRAQPGSAWITIMQNQNVAAVALLTEVSCVILAEGIKPDKELLDKADKKGINLLGSQLPSYELCCLIHELAGV